MKKSSWKELTPAVAAVLTLAVAAADLLWGGQPGASPGVITGIRLPRITVALIAGASLALGGLQMQSIFRNPLADPHIMGVSAGAGLGAAVAVLTAGSGLAGATGGGLTGAAAGCGLTLTGAAFMGAILAGILIMAVSTKVKSASTLLIFGIMLGYVFNAAVALLQFSSNAESLKLYYSWAAGSFSNCGWSRTGIAAICLAAGVALSLCNIRGLNIVLFGDEYAELSGSRVRLTRGVAMLGCCLMTASVTAFCGPLGFVGIVAPHIARRLCGSSDHAKTIPASIVTGAGLCVTADLAAQLWSRFASAVPTGSMLAVIGIPIVMVILLAGRSGR